MGQTRCVLLKLQSSGCPGEAEACVVRAWTVRVARDKGLHRFECVMREIFFFGSAATRCPCM